MAKPIRIKTNAKVLFKTYFQILRMSSPGEEAWS